MLSRNSVFMLTVGVLGVLAMRVEADETVNQKMVKYCEDNLGKQIGNGQCAALAAAALDAAGAKPRTGQDDPNPGDYKWGRPVFGWGEITGQWQAFQLAGGPQAGDLIQFRNATFQGTTANGGTYTKTATQHTVIIKSVTPLPRSYYQFEVYEQNNNGRLTVGLNTFNLNDMKAGFCRVYRADPK